jgi:hypothetical protein
MAFDPEATPIDFVLLTGKRSPGIATLEGVSRPRKWDEIVGYGYSGGFSVYRGQRLCHFKLHLDLVTEQDWVDWYAWRPILDRPPARQRPKALTIWHPWLVDAGIKSCVVEDDSQPVMTEPGIWRVTIPLLEFRAPKRVLAKPDASTNNPAAPQSAAEAAFVRAADDVAAKLKEFAQ